MELAEMRRIEAISLMLQYGDSAGKLFFPDVWDEGFQNFSLKKVIREITDYYIFSPLAAFKHGPIEELISSGCICTSKDEYVTFRGYDGACYTEILHQLCTDFFEYTYPMLTRRGDRSEIDFDHVWDEVGRRMDAKHFPSDYEDEVMDLEFVEYLFEVVARQDWYVWAKSVMETTCYDLGFADPEHNLMVFANDLNAELSRGIAYFANRTKRVWNFGSHAAIFRGTEIPVSGIRLSILKLIAQADSPMTRDEIRYNVWPGEEAINCDDRTINTHLCCLRRVLRQALKLPSNVNPIRTLRGTVVAYELDSSLRKARPVAAN
jgi:hypothetical protein